MPFRVAADSGVVRVSRPAGVGTASLWWTGQRRLEVESVAPLDSDDVYVDETSVFVAANRLAELIEGTIDVDVGTLTIEVKRASGFPSQIKLDARERRRAEAMQALAEEEAEEPKSIPFRGRTGAGVVEWAMGGPLRKTGAPNSVDLRGGMGLLGGMLQLRGMMLIGAAEGGVQLQDRELTYRRVFPGAAWLQQLQLGSVIGEGAEARAMRGVTVSNAPYVRGLRFDDVAFSRPLPPGWEYEVYEGARLVGFADGGRSTPLNVPLRYGTTPLRVRLYGPAGEIVESTVSYVIPVEQLRAHEWQYSAGMGQCVQRLHRPLVRRRAARREPHADVAGRRRRAARQPLAVGATVRRGELPPGARLDGVASGAARLLRARERAELHRRARGRRRQRRRQPARAKAAWPSPPTSARRGSRSRSCECAVWRRGSRSARSCSRRASRRRATAAPRDGMSR